MRDFLILVGLVRADEIVEENPPAQGSRRAVDLAALDTFIEFKRRIGTAGGFNPNPEYVQQLDDYLKQSGEQGRMRMGILTDGKRWLLRWPNAGPVRPALPLRLHAGGRRPLDHPLRVAPRPCTLHSGYGIPTASVGSTT